MGGAGALGGLLSSGCAGCAGLATESFLLVVDISFLVICILLVAGTVLKGGSCFLCGVGISLDLLADFEELGVLEDGFCFFCGGLVTLTVTGVCLDCAVFLIRSQDFFGEEGGLPEDRGLTSLHAFLLIPETREDNFDFTFDLQGLTLTGAKIGRGFSSLSDFVKSITSVGTKFLATLFLSILLNGTLFSGGAFFSFSVFDT